MASANPRKKIALAMSFYLGFRIAPIATKPVTLPLFAFRFFFSAFV
jgi:hypothetical protein